MGWSSFALCLKFTLIKIGIVFGVPITQAMPRKVVQEKQYDHSWLPTVRRKENGVLCKSLNVPASMSTHKPWPAESD